MDLSRIIPSFTPSKQITKDNKRESYNQILEDLGTKQTLVYNNLKNYVNGATAKELAVSMHSNGLVASPERNSVHPRLNELVELGLVEVIGKKMCQFTNRTVAIYRNKI